MKNTNMKDFLGEITSNIFTILILGSLIATWFFDFEPPRIYFLVVNGAFFLSEFFIWRKNKSVRNTFVLAFWAMLVIVNILILIIR